MTDGGKKKGFSGLDDLVSDVESGLKDAERSSRQHDESAQVSEPTTTMRPQGAAKSTPTQQPRRQAPPPPVDGGGEGRMVWLLILSGFIIFLIWAANQDGGSGRTAAPSSITHSPQSKSRPEPPPTLPTLTRPPVGTSHVHSSAEIRYCIATDIRIEALRPRMNTNDQIDDFNDIVSDYNSRCGSYQYRKGALESAKREIEPYRTTIVANAWDGLSLIPKSTPQQKPAALRSQLTMNIQKVLSDLAYDPGVADGLYGLRTAAAIEQYQRDYGHQVTGQVSEGLASQLQVTKQLISSAANKNAGVSGGIGVQVWIADMSRRLAVQVKDPEARIQLLAAVHLEAARTGLPPELVLAVIDVESSFDPYAVSVEGAIGLMQIMPFWLDEIGRPGDNLLHVNTNLRYGCTILKYYLNEEEGDLRRALARYDNSPGRHAYPNAVIEKLSTKWFEG